MFTKKDFYGTPGSRYAMLGCSWILCSILGVVIMSLITGEAATAGRMRIALVIQDIMIFVIPALITALFITRRPADLLCVRKGVSLSTIFTVAMIMIVSAPAMNIIIDANRSMHLPQFLAPVEQWMRQSEQSAHPEERSLQMKCVRSCGGSSANHGGLTNNGPDDSVGKERACERG